VVRGDAQGGPICCRGTTLVRIPHPKTTNSDAPPPQLKIEGRGGPILAMGRRSKRTMIGQLYLRAP
jgi:hypothetical protein